MINYLQTILLCFFYLSCFSQQTQRTKINNTSIINTTHTNKPSSNNTSINEKTINNVVIENVEMQNVISTNSDSIRENINLHSDNSNGIDSKTTSTQTIQPRNTNYDIDITYKKSIIDTNSYILQDNVTYTKEPLPQNVEKNISEKKSTKVTTSVNYKPRVIREDVTPTTNNTNNTTNDISPNKRIYLQQEADDLQVEISLNKNNPNYNLENSRKKLEYILNLLK